MKDYPGSKGGSGVAQLIINQIPPHDTYIEPFLGTGVILRTKRPAATSIGMDIDPQTAATFVRETGLAVACGCALQLLRSYLWTGREFVYLDPPYLESTRRSGARIYRREFMSEAEHEQLLDAAMAIPAPVMISGYASELYAKRLANWRIITYTAMTHVGPATECLWCNYAEPVELHDYRFLGANFTDRQRVKRKTARWTAKLRALPLLEKRALMAAIEAMRA